MSISSNYSINTIDDHHDSAFWRLTRETEQRYHEVLVENYGGDDLLRLVRYSDLVALFVSRLWRVPKGTIDTTSLQRIYGLQSIATVYKTCLQEISNREDIKQCILSIHISQTPTFRYTWHDSASEKRVLLAIGFDYVVTYTTAMPPQGRTQLMDMHWHTSLPFQAINTIDLSKADFSLPCAVNDIIPSAVLSFSSCSTCLNNGGFGPKRTRTRRSRTTRTSLSTQTPR